MGKMVSLNRAQAHNAIRQIETQLSSAVRKLVGQLLVHLDEAGFASVKTVHAELFPMAETTSAAAQLSTLGKKIEAAAKEKGVLLQLQFSGSKRDGVANRRVCLAAPPPAPIADTEGLDAIDPAQHIMGQLTTPLQEPRILLLTYNEHEFAAVRKKFYGCGTPSLRGTGANVVDDLGLCNGWHILHGHSRQGNRESQRSVAALHDAHTPHFIISVGIAFGVDEEKQTFGDVLISKFIIDYETGRVSPTGISLRGHRPPAARPLIHALEQLNVRQATSVFWPRVQLGGLLSGEKLIDDLDYRDSLKSLATQDDIIGGEMEAAGLFTALDGTGTGWVVIKAICDFADGNKNKEKERRQKLASENAAMVVHTLITSPFLPHPSTPGEPERKSPISGIDKKTVRCVTHVDMPLDRCELVRDQLATQMSLENVLRADEASDGPKVEALKHMLQWLEDETAPPLYALLGEYGMGKTTHCQMLTRHLEKLRTEGQPVPTPLYFDLRKVERIAPLNQQGPGHVATLEESIQDCLRNGYLQTGGQAPSYQEILDIIDDGALVIFDGLDEVLSRITDAQGLKFTGNLLRVVAEAKARQTTAGRSTAEQRLPKVLLSCRTQFFRNLAEQNSHLTGEHRGAHNAAKYMASVLQQFSEEQIRSYLRAVLPGEDLETLMAMIAEVHNLRDLAKRPFTLKLVAQFIPRIQQWRAEGRTITGATLYREVAREWLIRDKEKQTFQPEDKELLAGDLAAHLWRTDKRGLSARQLETWLDGWLALMPPEATIHQKPRELLHQDMRNSNFLKRIDSPDPALSHFEFAHTSLGEFFLADYLFRSLREAVADPANQQLQRLKWAMRKPSNETLDFLGQILAEAGQHSEELRMLSNWRKPYLLYASEVQLAYAVRAYQCSWPQPITAGSDLSSANLSEWHFGSLQEPDVGANAQQTPQFDLSNADFSGSTLRRCRFWRVRLDGADFSGAALAQAELLQCSLKNTSWEGVETGGLALRPVLQQSRADKPTEYSFLQRGMNGPTETTAGMRLGVASGHYSNVWSCAFSPDGTRIISGSDDRTLKLWDAESGECLRTFSGHSGAILSCAFSPDGTKILSGAGDKTLKLWDAQSGEWLCTFSGHVGKVTSCAVSPDGTKILSGSDDKTLKLWDAESAECLRTLYGHPGIVTSCAFSPDGTRILSGSSDSTSKLWDAESGECLRTFSGHLGEVKSCNFSPDGAKILSGSEDNTLKLWDVENGDCLRTFSGHIGKVVSCVFSADGTKILSGSDDKTLKLWDAESGECLRTFSGHPSEITSCAFSPDGTKILGANGKILKIWDAESGVCLRNFSKHPDGVWSCAFSPDGKQTLSGSYKALKLWDAESGECVRTFSGFSGWVASCVFSLDGTKIASASSNSIKLWDAKSGECLRTFSGHSGRVWSCAFSPDGTKIVSGSDDNTLKLWDVGSGECLRTFSGSGVEWSCAFSPDGTKILSAEASALKVWDTESGECLSISSGHSWLQICCAFSPDGTKILSGSEDNALNLWDAGSGECLRSFLGHSGWIMFCAFSADGTKILSGSYDKTLKLWDAGSGKCLRTFSGHSGVVWSCAFSPDGTKILSGSPDNTLRLWDAETGECLRTYLDVPCGAASWQDGDPTKLLYVSGRVWRYLRWQGYNNEGNYVSLPLESIPGIVVPPWTMSSA